MHAERIHLIRYCRFLPVMLFLSSLLAYPGLAAEPASPRMLTLDQALAIAVDQNRDIAKAKAYGEYVQGRYVEERAAALPQLSLNGTAMAAKDESQRLMGAGGRQYNRNIDLSLSQPLFTWGKIGAAIRAAEVGLKTADEQLRLARQGASRDVAGAFYDLLLARELAALARENLAQKQRHADEAHKKFAAGVATDYDVLAADVAVANARPEVIRSENQLKTSRERLRFFLALNEDVDAVGTLDHPLVPPVPLEEARAVAGRKRPELLDLRHRVGIYDELVTIAEAENKPRLDLKAGTGWHQFDLEGNRADGAAWSAGVYLSFPFFDGLRTSGRVQQAKSDLATKRVEEAKLLDSIDLEVRTANDAVKEAMAVVTALTGTVTQAQQLLQMAEKGFEFGVKTKLDVDDAQLNLQQAKSILARARRDYLVASVNLQWTMGALGER
jgi:HAE1 family hydrophobic/amphiphilic exporter-1